MDFSNAVVAGIPLILVVIGLVAWIKQLGVEGKALTISALIIGLVFGGGYQLSLKMPVDFAGWFGVIVYGLGVGLVGSGIYKAAGDIVSKVQPPQS